MLSLGKIPKPDVPPKRCRPKFRLLRSWITRLLFPARHLLPIGDAIAEQGSPPPSGKFFGGIAPRII